MMSIKTILIFSTIIGSLAKGCRGCSDEIGKTVIKSNSDEIVGNVITRLSRTAVRTSRFDSLFNKKNNYGPLVQAIYAMAYIDGKTSEDSSNLSDLSNFFLNKGGLQKFTNKDFDSTLYQDDLFRAGLRKAVLISLAKYEPSMTHGILIEMSKSVEKSGKSQKVLMNELIEREFYPYGHKMAIYFFSDSVQNILFLTKP